MLPLGWLLLIWFAYCGFVTVVYVRVGWYCDVYLAQLVAVIVVWCWHFDWLLRFLDCLGWLICIRLLVSIIVLRFFVVLLAC